MRVTCCLSFMINEKVDCVNMSLLAFDVGGTNVKYAVIDRAGQIIKKDKFPSPKHSLKDLVKAMGEVCKTLKEEFPLEGIALSVPGAPNETTGIIQGGSALPYLHGPNVQEMIEAETGLTLHMENDAKSAALCEVWKGAARDYNDAIFLVLGTGMGGAIVKDKKVHHGVDLLAGEFGYLILESDFEKGVFSTGSQLAATGGIIRQVAAAKGVDVESLTGEEIFQAAEEGSCEICVKTVERFYESVAVCMFNLMWSFDPEIIVVGGAISSRKCLIPKVKEKLEFIRNNFDANINDVNPDIVTCQFEGDANLLGAAYHYLQAENLI